MVRLTRGRLTYANVVASLALFVALGGGAYAATALPANSVGTTQLKSNAVVSGKVKDGSLLGRDFKSGVLSRHPQGPAGGDLRGSYPNPSLAPGAVTPDNVGVLPAVRATTVGPTDAPSGQDTPVPLTETGTADFDTANMHQESGYSPELVAPRDGLYEITASVSWLADTTGYRSLLISLNGTTTLAQDDRLPVNYIAGRTQQGVTTLARLNAGDYVEELAYQNTGNTLKLIGNTGSMSMHWLGPAS